MNKEDLRSLLNKPYQFENWKNVIDFVFPNVSYLQQPLTIPTDNEKVESFRQVGSLRLNDGKNLAIFEVHVKPNVNIARNRVELRNLVAGYIDQERNHGVLAIYEKGTDEYRFTYTAKETDYDEEKGAFVQKETEAKRFTYILGANETCRTARDRFWELSENKDKATIKDVENAFSVEKLSKEFFTKYKIQYKAFVDYLIGSAYKISAFKADEKAIRDFVKKMLGRIVFLHFVQKKGWLGASNAEYKDGDKQFMYKLWQNSKKNEAFYQLVLVPLFFEALNQNDRPDDAFTFPDETILRIPYLGGGLFEKDREDPDLLTFPPALFNGLFEFFNEYNFTIDENDPHENEVGIDPEMLGQIFENLLEDNKDKGAFYTPKPIVKYMCQESLIQYLLTAFEKEGVITDETEKKELQEKLGKMVKKYEANEVIEYDHILAKALYDVKICDPAIGSGAFPMGILNEIVMLINLLHDASPDVVNDRWKMTNWQPATVKKHIIQNSIYGVDIEKGAVDIARLRFWLSLIIDEEKPCNLPSLDYKIVVGNSLISKFEDEVIDIDWEVKEVPTQGNLFGDENEKARQKLLNNISQKQIAFYAAENHQKEKLELDIRNLKIDLLINQLQLQIKKKGLEKVPELSKGNTLKNQTEQYLKTQGWRQTITKLENLKKHPEKAFLHFDWKLDFPEVLNPEIVKGIEGFDIVIGNPPYGALLTELEKEILKNEYSNIVDRIRNSFLYFTGLATKLAKTKGVLFYIIPNEFLFQIYMGKAREYYLNKTKFLIAIDMGLNVFEAVVPSCIIGIKKELEESNYDIKVANLRDKKSLTNIGESLLIINKGLVEIYPNSTFAFNEEKIKIIQKLSSKGKSLGNLSEDLANGISTSCDDIYIVDIEIINKYNLEKELLFECLRGNQIEKYKLPSNSPYYIVYVTKDTDLKNYPNTFKYLEENKDKLISSSVEKRQGLRKWEILFRPRDKDLFLSPKIIFRQTGDKPICVADFKNNYYCIDSLNVCKLNAKYNDKINYIVSLCNSQLCTFYYQEISQEKGRALAQIKPQRLKALPIIFNDEKEELINELNSKIESETDDNTKKEIMLKIDLIVYKLYELTYDEVLVVDPAFALSEQEYNDFSY